MGSEALVSGRQLGVNKIPLCVKKSKERAFFIIYWIHKHVTLKNCCHIELQVVYVLLNK